MLHPMAMHREMVLDFVQLITRDEVPLMDVETKWLKQHLRGHDTACDYDATLESLKSELSGLELRARMRLVEYSKSQSMLRDADGAMMSDRLPFWCA